jgi:hypothetical protein
MTHQLSGPMTPHFSASGMNTSGPITPRTGCIHRTSASKPMTCIWSSETIGW